MYKLPKSWSWVETGDITDGLVPGRTKPKRFDGDIPWITLPDLDDLYVSLSKKGLAVALEEAEAVGMKVMPKGTVLMSCVGQFGLICITVNKVVPNQQLHGFVCLQDIVPEYLAYALKTQVRQMERMASATTISYLNKTKCNSIKLPLSPLKEQHRIVTKIEALTTRSRKARQALDTIPALLDQFRQSVLAAAFRGDLTADWRSQNPDVEPAEKLLERIRVERRARWEAAELEKMKAKGKVPKNDKWKEKYKEPEPIDISELPELPQGWLWASATEACENVFLGLTSKVDYVDDGGIPLIRAGDIRNGVLNFSKARYISREQHEHLTRYRKAQKGDVLVSKSGSLGTCALVDTERKFSIYESIIVLQPGSGLLQHFLLYLLRSPQVQRRMLGNTVGSTVGHLNLTTFRQLAIPIAPLAEQKILSQRLESMTSATSTMAQNLRACLSNELTVLDQSILAKAFRGQLVPQDPTDEPASLLLQRIQAEREKLQKKGKGKKGKGKGKKTDKAPTATKPSGQLDLL